MKKLTLLLAFLSFTTSASELQKVKVHTFEESTELSKFGEEYDVSKVKPVKDKESQPTPHDVDKLLSEAGLIKELGKLDQLGKDILVHHAKTYDLKKLIHKYPSYDPEKLRILKELVKE